MDPILYTIQLSDCASSLGLPIFDLTRNLSSISIRDQIVRATLVGQSLPAWLRAVRGETRDLPVLVVGGGVAGMTLAIQLARGGQTVEVVDPSPKPFSVQRGCCTRWIDPVQYDWPMDHWSKGVFPWDRKQKRRRVPMPLTCDENWANEVVRGWDADLFHHSQQKYAKRIQFHWRRLLCRPPLLDADDNVVAELCEVSNRGNRNTWGKYRALVFAFGFGKEICKLDKSAIFVGYEFWDTDPFQFPNCGLPVGDEGTVLISGTGDGGLQDFLRIMTRQSSAKTIYHELELYKTSVNLNRIFSVAERLERAAAWESVSSNYGTFSKEGYLLERHRACQMEARRVFQQMEKRVLGYLDRRPKKTILVGRRNYFENLYILNQFLALLFIEALRMSEDDGIRDSVEVYYSHQVSNIQSVAPFGPPTSLDAQSCLGRNWELTLEDLKDPSSSGMTVPANVIILRHGLDRSGGPYPIYGSSTSCPRPMPPTHFSG